MRLNNQHSKRKILTLGKVSLWNMIAFPHRKFFMEADVMLIRTIQPKSLLQQISENPSTDVVVGSDRQPPQELTSDIAMEVGQGQNLYKLSSKALSHREKLIGKSIKLAELSLSGVEQGLILSRLNLPQGTNTAFAATGFILSGTDMYHSLTKDNLDAIEIAVASTKTLAAAADLVAPFVPILCNYQPHLKFATILLKAIGTGKEVLELTYNAKNLESLR